MKSKNLSLSTGVLFVSQICFLSSAMALSVDPNKLKLGAISSVQESKGEECIIPGTIPNLGSGVAEDKQTKLCGIDFYNDPKIAVCPKEFSTNPAIEPYEVPDGVTAQQFASKDCAIPEKKRPGKKLAKFKSTITCSDTGSILSYYEISKILGGIGMVPSTVFRTMNIVDHKALAIEGEAGALKSSWAPFATDDASPLLMAKHPEIYTADKQFVYGAFSENPSGDAAYNEFVGHRINYADGFHAFSQTPLFLALTSANPVGVDKTLAAAAQKVTALKDMSDMILMDTLLNQQDRFGNEAKQEYYVWVENGKIQQMSQKKAEGQTGTEDQLKSKGAVLIAKLLMKDNDCGVSKTNWMKKNNVLSKLHHMSAETYHLFMNFANQVAANPNQYAQYFETQMIYTQLDWISVSGNISASRATLLANCKSGALSLDLDLDSYLGLASSYTKACE